MSEATPQPTVLVVDDERGPRQSLRLILSPTYRVLEAATGAEALELLRRTPVDVVTLDLKMPGMAGEDVMRAVRSEFPGSEVIVITGCGSVESATEGIRQGIADYLLKPFDVVQVSAAVTRALLRGRSRTRLLGFLEELGDVVGRSRDARRIVDDVQRSHKLRGRLGSLFDALDGDRDAPWSASPIHPVEFLEVLAEAIESKDRFMRGHARRVAFYSCTIGERMGLTAAEQERLRIAAFCHDLGKVAVPSDLLLRAGGLDPHERAVIEQHPVVGARLLKPLDLDEGLRLAVRHHHEWWDGTGYPDGLSGEEIPLGARVIAVADAYDAMSSDRPYRHALARDVAVSELRRYAGTQFDPAVAAEFLAALDSGAGELDVQAMAEAASALGDEEAAPESAPAAGEPLAAAASG